MKQSREMPEPQVLDYDAVYRVSQVFINDFMKVMSDGDVAYADVQKMLDVVKSNNGVLPAGILNEFVRSLANMPYRVIAPLMRVIENNDNFVKYFEPIPVVKK